MKTKDVLESISKNIKKYRLLNNLTQERMAELLYVDTQYYAQMERGERNFTIEKIVNACMIFHITVDKIINIEEGDNQDKEKLIESISSELEGLSHKQLMILKKVLSDIIPTID